LALYAIQYSFELSIPRSVPLISATLIFLSVSCSRFALRSILISRGNRGKHQIAVYGADASGIQVVRALQYNPHYQVRMVIDDNPKRQIRMLFGIRVLTLEHALKRIKKNEIDTIIIAKRQINNATKKRLLQKLAPLSVKFKSVPPIDRLLSDTFAIPELPDISIEDLVGREIMAPMQHLMTKNIKGKIVMVTGPGGSIGSELCRQCLSLQPKKLIILDVSEAAAYQIQQELEGSQVKRSSIIVTLIGSVADEIFINKAIRTHHPDTIYHAAAYKHVPLMEANPIQAVYNNALGTLVLAQAAFAKKVKNFTLISTDKAVNPSNIMGASKRLAELICKFYDTKISRTRFSIVRFGNVLGSSGSVVPLFQQQIKRGGPITLTHPDILRYFMTINEAVTLVIQASSLSQGGETFILDMGEPVKILDLAINMARMSGFEPLIEGQSNNDHGEITIRITGLRPGEKLFEELSYGTDLINTEHPRILMANENGILHQKFEDILKLVKNCIQKNDEAKLSKILQSIVNYCPTEINKLGEQ